MARKKRPATKKATKKAKKGRVGSNPEPVAVAQSEPVSPQPPTLTLEAIDAFRVLTEEVSGLREEVAGERKNDLEFRQLVLSTLTDLAEKIKRYDELEGQVIEDQSVDAATLHLRMRFAGGCHALGIQSPTPAIIGRTMHDTQAFLENAGTIIVPRRMFEIIYANKGRGIPDHLSPKITELLEEVTEKNSKKTARLLGEEFDTRFDLIIEMGFGEKSDVRVGTTYRRVLVNWGVKVFHQWPDWHDASGGLSLGVPPPLASVEPEPDGAVSSVESPAAIGPVAGEAPAPPAGSIDTPASESPDSPSSPPA